MPFIIFKTADCIQNNVRVHTVRNTVLGNRNTS